MRIPRSAPRRQPRTTSRCLEAVRHCAAASLVVLVVSGCRHDTQPNEEARGSGTFVALAALPGDLAGEAAAVSGDGRVVVGTSISSANRRSAFRWTPLQGPVPLGLLPQGSFTSAAAASGDGAVIVGTADGGSPAGLHGFRWTVDSGLIQLEALAGANACAATAVSGDGSVVVGTCLAPMDEAFRWTGQTGAAGLGRFGPGSNAMSTASAVSYDGQVIGGAGNPVLTGAVIWDANGTPTIIGGLPGDIGGTITALSRNGTFAVGVSLNAAARERAFRWSATTGVTALAASDTWVETVAAAVSADGNRAVGWGRHESGSDVAVMWDASATLHPVSDLLSRDGQTASAGWTLTRARGISADGRAIVGEGLDPSGVGHGWMVVLHD